jgi:hypothetical protein
VSSPTAPSPLDSVATGDGAAMAISGDHAYLLTQLGVVSVDISNPAAMSIDADVEFWYQNTNINHLEADGDVLYASSSGGMVQAIDISDPTDPYPIGMAPRTYGGSIADGGLMDAGGDIAHLFTSTQGPFEVDLADPRRPLLVERWEGNTNYPGTAARDSSGNLYAGGGGAGVMKFDTSPLDYIDRANTLTSGIGDGAMFVDDGKLYWVGSYWVTEYDTDTTAFQQWVLDDITDPGWMVPFGTYLIGCDFGEYIWLNRANGDFGRVPLTDFGSFFSFNGIGAVNGNTLALVESEIIMLDITDPENPTLIDSYEDFVVFDSSGEGIVFDGTYLYLPNTEYHGLIIFDASDLSVVGQVTDATDLPYPNTILKVGDICYLGCEDVIAKVDVSNPAAPTIIASEPQAFLYSTKLELLSGPTKDYIVASDGGDVWVFDPDTLEQLAVEFLGDGSPDAATVHGARVWVGSRGRLYEYGNFC